MLTFDGVFGPGPWGRLQGQGAQEIGSRVAQWGRASGDTLEPHQEALGRVLLGDRGIDWMEMLRVFEAPEGVQRSPGDACSRWGGEQGLPVTSNSRD